MGSDYLIIKAPIREMNLDLSRDILEVGVVGRDCLWPIARERCSGAPPRLGALAEVHATLGGYALHVLEEPGELFTPDRRPTGPGGIPDAWCLISREASDRLHAAYHGRLTSAIDGLSRAFQALPEIRAEAAELAHACADSLLEQYAETHPTPEHRETARAELLRRRQPKPLILRDDFDNLPDAEPEGIVRRR